MIRLLLGTRWHVCDHLGRDWRDRCEVINLDGHDYADPPALAALVRRILIAGTPTTGTPTSRTPFTSCPQPVLDAVTAAIAEAAGKSFFVARILAATQASQPAVPDPADVVWRASLPGTAGPAMRRDLEIRLRDQAARAVDLLRPLAYAQGRGLPWEDMWALLANALAPGHGYTNEDRLWLAGHVGSFIVEGGTISGRSVYRLYHRSLAEDLIAGRDQAADEHAITTTLAAHVPRRFSGRPDWPASHPYIRAHLATHTVRGGNIDDLAQDPGFLLAASPPQLLAALDTATSMPARAAGGAYRSALPLIRRHPSAEHASYLGLAARCGRAKPLADRLDADGLEGPWSARWASWQLQHPHQQLTGHADSVRSVVAAEVDGRPVVISGSSDRTVRVWDLATGTPVGKPFTGHTGAVNAVAAAQLDGRPVVISGSSDRTVRVWDLATRTPVGDPFTGHAGDVLAVAAAQLDGRPGPTALQLRPAEASPMEPDVIRSRQLDVRSLLVVLALLLAGCSSGSHIASRANPHTALTPAHRHPSAPMAARVVLPSRTLTAGSSMTGHVLVKNTTGHAIHVSGCVTLFQVLLTSSTYKPTVGWLTCLQQFTIPVGESRYSVTVWASYSQCSQGRPQHGLRACLPHERMPPLQPGTYHAKLFQAHNLVRVPSALTVRVTLPMRSHR